MTRTLLIGSLAAFIPVTGLIAEGNPAPALDLAARKESVANLEAHIAQREQRLAEWARDLVQLDARIEKQVEDLVKMLSGLRDSQESRTKVTQLKKSAIEGLKRGIDLYAKKRKEIREMVRTGGGNEALEDLAKIDQRILKRVDQIAELTKSIPTHEDVEKYESDGGTSYWDGYYYETSRVTDEWKQNRRDTNQSDQQREDTTKALKEAIERLDQRRRSLKDLLANRNISESARTLYNTELGQIDAYEEHINAQLRDVAVGGGGGGRAVGREQAHDIEALLEDARRDLREDVSRLFLTYDQYVRGRAYLEGLKENLAARKEWLEKNSPKASGTP
jgi:site-specific DNA-adenine methylase